MHFFPYSHFEVSSGFGKVTFRNKTHQGGCFHTLMPLASLVTLTGVKQELECDADEVMHSVALYVNADNYIARSFTHAATLMGVFGEDTIKKLNYLKAESCGVYLHFPGYRFNAFKDSEVYDWLNTGTKEYGSNMHIVRGAFPNPLYAA